MEEIKTDTVVIGGGPGGYSAAIRMGQLGIDTVLVEKHKLGGTCLNVGCIPSKALLYASGEYKKTKSEHASIGITSQSTIDWGKTMEWKDKLVTKIVAGVGFLVKSNKVKLVNGLAKFADKNTLLVGDTHKIIFQRAILATGSKIIEIPIFPFDGEKVLSSDHLLSMKTVPKSMILLGGGIIGMELGTVYASLGCEVTVVEALPGILPMYEKEASSIVHKEFEKLGGKILTGRKATSHKVTKAGVEVTHTSADGSDQQVSVAEVFAVAVGRKPNIEGLSLENLGLEMDGNRIKVDDQFRTNISHISAIGDLIDGPMLAHKASAEGVLCAEGLHGEKISRKDIKVIPDVVYTKPEIAKAGLSREEAEQRGFKTIEGKFPFSALGRASTTNESTGYIKYIVDEETKTILGCVVVSTKASELIAEAALAIEFSANIDDVALTVHPHPTFSEAHMEAAAAALKKAIHTINK